MGPLPFRFPERRRFSTLVARKVRAELRAIMIAATTMSAGKKFP